jgi:hypothetical protein
LLNFPLGQESVDKGFDQVFVFLGEFFHFLELVQQFFIGNRDLGFIVNGSSLRLHPVFRRVETRLNFNETPSHFSETPSHFCETPSARIEMESQ